MAWHRAWGKGVTGVAVVLAATTIWAAGSMKRAKPPHWTKSVNDAFFTDAREKLSGERPAAGGGGGGGAVAGAAAGGGNDSDGGGASSGGVFTWSKLIGPEELEDEIKTMQKQVSENVGTRAPFVGGGYKVSRRQFTELALLFGIIAEYDGEVRWKKDAPSMRDLLARTGFNCKVGTDASYNESKLRKDELETLVRGGSAPSVPGAEAKAVWDKVVGRSPLMQRLEMAQQQGVALMTANADDFKKNVDKVAKEAELIAAIAEVIQREGFEFADDQTYLGFAKQMRDAALEIVQAAKSKNYDPARAASGKIDKACSQCHEGYRS
jgi:hypothetical protein